MCEHFFDQAIISCTRNYPFVFEVVKAICNSFSDVVCILHIINQDIVTKSFKTH